MKEVGPTFIANEEINSAFHGVKYRNCQLHGCQFDVLIVRKHPQKELYLRKARYEVVVSPQSELAYLFSSLNGLDISQSVISNNTLDPERSASYPLPPKSP